MLTSVDDSVISLPSVLARLVKMLISTARQSQFAIMSGFENKTGIDRTGALANELRRRGFTTVIEGFGSYKGEKERSLMILPKSDDGTFTDDEITYLNNLAIAYYQESYFLNAGMPLLRYSKAGASLIGRGQFVTGDGVKDLDYYSDFAGVKFAVV